MHVHPVRSALVAVAALAAAAAPVGASAPEKPTASSAPVVATGRLEAAHSDDFATGRAVDAAFVDDGRAVVEVVGLDHASMERYQGHQVEIRGQRVGHRATATAITVAAADSTSTVESTSTATVAAATETRQVLAILIDLPGVSNTTTAATTRNVLFGSTGSTASYVSTASYGARTIAGQAVGPYALQGVDTSTCAYGSWMTAGRAAATAAGIDVTAFQHVMLVIPPVSVCGWAGLGSVGGANTWVKSSSMGVRVTAHELGHNFSWGHAATLRCTSAGTVATMSDTCTLSEYGDPFDVMGASTRHPSSYHRAKLGWITDSRTVTASGTYALDATTRSGTRQLRVDRPDTTSFFLELRGTASAWDTFASTDPVVNGVSVRIGTDTYSYGRTQLLDATPSTSSFADAPFRAGTGFTDPLSGTRIDVDSVVDGQAQVRVTLAGTTTSTTSTTTTTTTTTTQPAQSTVRIDGRYSSSRGALPAVFTVAPGAWVVQIPGSTGKRAPVLDVTVSCPGSSATARGSSQLLLRGTATGAGRCNVSVTANKSVSWKGYATRFV